MSELWAAIVAWSVAHLWVLSCFFMTSTATLCLLGLIAPAYRENLLMNLGMGILTIGSASRTANIFELQAVAPDWLMVHAGMGLYAWGQFISVLQRLRRKTRRQEVVDTVGIEMAREISRWQHSTARVRDTGAHR